MYKRLFTKMKENYSLKKEVQARMKSNAKLIKEQILAEKGTTCFVITPIFNTAHAKPLLVHESRLKLCKADLKHIKSHIGSDLLS